MAEIILSRIRRPNAVQTLGRSRISRVEQLSTSEAHCSTTKSGGICPDEPLGEDPVDVAVEASGDFLVIDDDAGTNGRGALFRVRPNGSRMMLSNFGVGAPQLLGVDPIGIAIEASGNILAVDPNAGTGKDRCIAGAKGALFRVNPRTGERRLLSNFGDNTKGKLGTTPHNVAVTLTRLWPFPPQPDSRKMAAR